MKEAKKILVRTRNLLSQSNVWGDTPEWKEQVEKLKLDIINILNNGDLDYSWNSIQDYEKDVGFEVNFAFETGWRMARTTNGLFNRMREKHED